MKKMTSGIIALFSLLLGLGFLSCSRTEPRILYGYIGLAYYPGASGPQERYTFFILPEDDDGIENLAELYLYNDRHGLKWLLTSDDWLKIEEVGNTWIGSRNIAMYADGPLPRGQYRAVLYNKGGEKTESKFTFDGPEEPPYPFPSLSFLSNTFTVDSYYPVNRLVFYDQEGRIAETVMLGENSGALSDLGLADNYRSMILWAEDPEYHISAITPVVVINE